MKRREARELAFSLIFESEYDIYDTAEKLYSAEMELRGFEDDEYIRRVLSGIWEHKAEIDSKISENSHGWKLERISHTSLAIMSLSVCEMLYLDDISYNISINEAVELAKKYDDDNAPAFINGILNSIAEKEGLKTDVL